MHTRNVVIAPHFLWISVKPIISAKSKKIAIIKMAYPTTLVLLIYSFILIIFLFLIDSNFSR